MKTVFLNLAQFICAGGVYQCYGHAYQYNDVFVWHWYAWMIPGVLFVVAWGQIEGQRRKGVA